MAPLVLSSLGAAPSVGEGEYQNTQASHRQPAGPSQETVQGQLQQLCKALALETHVQPSSWLYFRQSHLFVGATVLFTTSRRPTGGHDPASAVGSTV